MCFRIFDKTYPLHQQINVRCVNKHFPKNLSRVLEIRRLIVSGSFDIVIGFGLIPGILTALSKIGLKTPVIVCERNDPRIYPLIWKIIRFFAYLFASGAVFQTEEASRFFKPCFFKQRTVIPNPLQIEDLPNGSGLIRKKEIVNTSRLVPAKNHRMLLEAFSRIANDYPEYTLSIYGDGPLKKELSSIIEKRSLSEKIQIIPPTRDVLSHIMGSEIFVLSSNHEGFPNSLAEAMALGISCVSTNCRIGGPKDMIQNNQNGILVAVNDTSGLEIALRRLISDAMFRQRISKEAYKIREILDSRKIGARWIEFLSHFISDQEENKNP